MDAIEAGPRRHTRRTVVWALFGVVGLIMGAAWATGFAQSQSTTNTNSNQFATDVVGTGSAAGQDQSPSPYSNLITDNGGAQLDIGCDGVWGTIAADTAPFNVGRSGTDANSQSLAGHPS